MAGSTAAVMEGETAQNTQNPAIRRLMVHLRWSDLPSVIYVPFRVREGVSGYFMKE